MRVTRASAFAGGTPALPGRALPVAALDGGEVHVRVFGEGVAHPPPDAALRSADEALIDAVPVAVFGRKRPPSRAAGARPPRRGFDEALAAFFVPNPHVGTFP